MAVADVKSNRSNIRVLIVDDHDLARMAIKTDLNRCDGLTVIGTAANGLEAITLAQQLQPDVILMDLQMPIMDGLTASKQIKISHPEIRILAYTSLIDPPVDMIAWRAAIDQLCRKDMPIQEVVACIHQCLDKTTNSRPIERQPILSPQVST